MAAPRLIGDGDHRDTLRSRLPPRPYDRGDMPTWLSNGIAHYIDGFASASRRRLPVWFCAAIFSDLRLAGQPCGFVSVSRWRPPRRREWLSRLAHMIATMRRRRCRFRADIDGWFSHELHISRDAFRISRLPRRRCGLAEIWVRLSRMPRMRVASHAHACLITASPTMRRRRGMPFRLADFRCVSALDDFYTDFFMIITISKLTLMAITSSDGPPLSRRAMPDAFRKFVEPSLFRLQVVTRTHFNDSSAIDVSLSFTILRMAAEEALDEMIGAMPISNMARMVVSRWMMRWCLPPFCIFLPAFI